jgi:non-homologous end joining protein Ku
MSNGFYQEPFVDEHCDQDEDDLGDFIVYSDDDEESLKHKQHQQELEDEHHQELEDEVEEEVEDEEEVDEEEEAPVGQQEILNLREQLKEEIRRKNAAIAASARKPNLSSTSKNQTMPPVKDG